MAELGTLYVEAKVKRRWMMRVGTRLIWIGGWFLRQPYVETYAEGQLLGTKPLAPRITIELGAFDKGVGEVDDDV